MFRVKKIRNKIVEKFLRESCFEIDKLQSYFPIISKFAKRRSNNKFAKICLDYKIENILDFNPNNTIALINGEKHTIHIKQTPLICTLDIFYGRLPDFKSQLFLPNNLSKELIKKINNSHNSAYIELICLFLLNKVNKAQFPILYDYYFGISKEYKEIIDDDDLSDDEDLDELISNGYEITKEYDSDEEYTLIHPTMPVAVMIQEKLDKDFDDIYEDVLKNFLSHSKFPRLNAIRKKIFDDKMSAWLMQILVALKSANDSIDFVHNDLHIHNVMGKQTEKQFIIFQLDDKSYKVPTYGWRLKIIDFGRSTFKINNKLVLGDVFDDDNEAEGQYTKKILPCPSFDLARFACSFFEDLEEEERQKIFETDTGKLFKNWTISDDNKIDFMEIEGFSLYTEIAKKFRKKTPSNQIENLKIFKQFLI